MPCTLGYWKIRGLAQPIRLLLEYVGEDYEEVHYGSGPGCKNWMVEKKKIGLPLPNLPYYIEGSLKLTQSNAILRHIGRKHNLMGRDADQTAIVDMLLDTYMDFRVAAAMVFYDTNWESRKSGLLVDTKDRFKKLTEFTKDNRKWFAGEEITVADFAMYEYLMIMQAFEKELLDGFDWLKEFISRFEGLEAVSQYQASDRYISYPFNGATAKWGAK